MNNKKLTSNLSYQTIYQVLTILTPLITAPYLSRVLGASQLGVFSYTSSIVGYFSLFAMFGTVNYGTRYIASVSSMKKERSKAFWEIYWFQSISGLSCLAIYIGYVYFLCKENMSIAYLQAISIIACIFNINWLLFGLEEFATVTFRNIIVKLAEFILILTCVNDSSDLPIYILIMLGGTFFSNLYIFVQIKNYVDLINWKILNIKQHIRGNLTLFVPLLAISVYHIMDKTMLGLLSTYIECGYYYNSDKLVNIPLCVINGVVLVLLPRITNMISTGNKKEALKLFNNSLELIIVIGVGMSFGIAAIAEDFVPVFFGKAYETCIMLAYLFAPIIVIKGMAASVRMEYLIPFNEEKKYLFSVCIGALVNFILNLLFIPKMAALGAVLATLGAEFAACAFQFFTIRNEVNVLVSIKNCLLYSIIGIFMFTSVKILSVFLVNIYIKIVFEILTGIIIYGASVLLYWTCFRKEYIEMFVSKNISV